MGTGESRTELTLWQRAVFSLGTLGSAAPGVTIVQLQPFFSRLGYSASIISHVRFFSLVFDAVTDPLMGYISDRTRSRFGRRLPYIAIGSLLFGAGLTGMWMAPEGLSTFQFYVYLIVMQIVYTLGVTMTGVPYQAMIPELAREYSVRTSLVSWMQAGTYLGSIWGGAVRAYANWRGDELSGFREFALYCSLLMAICYWLLAVLLKEPPCGDEQGEVRGGGRRQLRTHLAGRFADLGLTLRRALADREFLVLFLSVFVYQVGVLAGLWMYPYILSDWFGGLWDTPFARSYVPGVFREPYFLWIFFGITCGALFLPFWNWLGHRLEKRTCLILGILGVGSSYAISYFVFAPKSYPLLILYCLFLAFVHCPANIFPFSMIADIATYAKWRTGRSDEGMYYGAWSFLVKLYNGVAIFWTGFALDHIVRYQPGKDVVQSEETLHRMRLLYAAPAGITAVFAVCILARYGLSRRRMAEVNAALRTRAATPTAAESR